MPFTSAHLLFQEILLFDVMFLWRALYIHWKSGSEGLVEMLILSEYALTNFLSRDSVPPMSAGEIHRLYNNLYYFRACNR